MKEKHFAFFFHKYFNKLFQPCALSSLRGLTQYSTLETLSDILVGSEVKQKDIVRSSLEILNNFSIASNKRM